MSLAAGTRLGPYEVLAKLGEGGMGEVYKARDTRLERTVAIKVLPAELNADPERRTRFEREARTIASLAHPHICTLHDVGEHASTGSGQATLYLVMEHLQGETLADRLVKGRLPLDQALKVATEIADALAAAHKHGIVHRDLKPGNVMLTSGGAGRPGLMTAKLLDFGLAKLTGHGEHPALVGDVTAPTMTLPITERGTILGTLQYMAPEQLEGKEADSRTDLWALGAILYEMLTGTRAFEGDSAVSLLAAIMDREPSPITSLQPLTPPMLDRLVRKCLRKDPDARWQTAADVADELRWVAASSGAAGAAPPVQRRSRGWVARAAVLAFLIAFTAITAAIVAWRAREDAAGLVPPTFLAIPVSTSNLTLEARGLALSPDGQTTAFVATRPGERPLLFVRRLNDKDPQALKDTDDARQPFFSPDGQQVAFFKRGQVMRVALGGGKPQPLTTDPDWLAGELQFGGSWGTNDRVIFGGGYIRPGIWQVRAHGGRLEELVKGEEGAWYNFPDLLPDDKGVVFTIYRGGRSSVNAWSRTSPVHEVLGNASRARYLPAGHLLYEEAGSLRIIGFNCDTLQTEGEPSVVVEDVGTAWSTATWDVSRAGTLVYTPPYVGLRRLVWRDRLGNTTPLPLNERPYLSVSLSPDNQRLVVGIGDGLRRQLWSGPVDAEPLQPFTYGYDDLYHAFSPDGRWVAFTRHDKGRYNIFRTQADGSGTPEQLTEGDRPQGLPAFSPDGRILLFATPEATGDFHLWQKPLDPEGPPRPFIRTPSVKAETHAAFSPDGRSVAYMSDEGGDAYQVWVQPYPDGRRIQVSTAGGVNPVWHPDRAAKELFYQGPTSLMSVRFSDGRPGRPVALFPLRPVPAGLPVYQFAVGRAGERFLMFDSVESATQPSLIYVVSNWLEPVKAKPASPR